MKADEFITENLHKWFKEKWVRFGPDGKIKGPCARGSEGEGKPKCLPQKKAQSLGKKGRASAAARKRREDPNPNRSGKAINVNTKKKKTNEGEVITLPIVYIQKAADEFKKSRMLPPITDDFNMDLLTRQIIKFLFKNPSFVGHIPAEEIPIFAHKVAVYLARKNNLPIREEANKLPKSKEEYLQNAKSFQNLADQAKEYMDRDEKSGDTQSYNRYLALYMNYMHFIHFYNQLAGVEKYDQGLIDYMIRQVPELRSDVMYVHENANLAQQAAIAIAKKKSGKYNKVGKRINETAEVSDADIAYLAAKQIIKGYTFNELKDIVEQLFRLAKKYNMNLNDFVEAKNAVLANKRTTKEALELLLKPFKAAAERASRKTLEATTPNSDGGDSRGARLGVGRSKTTLEDFTGEFSAQRTPEENPYGGLRSRKFRGAISETPNESPVGYQPGGWRVYKPKVSGLEEMDSFDNYTPYKAKPAGLKETDFKKIYYTLIVNGKSISTSNNVKKLHKLANDYKKEKPDAEVQVKSSTGVDEARTIGLYNPQKQKKQFRVVYANNKPIMYFGINDITELKSLLDYMKEKNPNVKIEVKKEAVTEDKDSIVNTDKLADTVIDFYKNAVKKVSTKPVKDFDSKAQELISQVTDARIKKKVISVLNKARENPMIQGGVITAVGAIVAGKILGYASGHDLSPRETNVLLQGVLNTVIPTMVSIVNNKDWKSAIKYVLASFLVGVGMASLEETNSTGMGGGSAGIGGGGGVGYPTTYEEEYGMFKRKGSQRPMPLTF